MALIMLKKLYNIGSWSQIGAQLEGSLPVGLARSNLAAVPSKKCFKTLGFGTNVFFLSILGTFNLV